MYTCLSPYGTFTIKPDLCCRAKWCLWLEEDVLGTYDSPEEAARAVHARQTGNFRWDADYQTDVPAELDAWLPTYLAWLEHEVLGHAALRSR
ncbi:MAG: hypothetical protein FJ387_15155 [Verrucomicrobia bacterium]|nr:hypothetical protein [Verrucomicrobiota bacterium]